MRLSIMGFGYSARRFLELYGGRFATIRATARRAETARELTGLGIEPLLLNAEGGAQLQQAIAGSDVIVVSAGPDATGDPFLRHVEAGLEHAQQHAPVILYLSTVGVYGDHAGGWVNEETPVAPRSSRSRWRVAAEEGWLALARRRAVTVHILRLSGIYGPGRSAIDSLRRGEARRLIKPGQVFNRIHVDDIASCLMALTGYRGSRRIWNVTDDEPAPPQDVVTHAARLLGVEPPPEIPFETAQLSDMARSFYGENKRVSNRAIREELGVALTSPTYREGLATILRVQAAR